MIFTCPKCGTKNRIPEQKESGKEYRCGNCHTKLIEISQNQADTISKRPSSFKPNVKGIKRRLKSLRESWLKPPIVHPLLIGIFPILALYSQNMHELSFSDTYSTLGTTIVITIVMLVLLWLIFRNAMKVGIALSVFIILFFSYGHIVGPMEEAGILIARQLVAVLWIVILMIITYFITRIRKDLRTLTIVLNVISVCLVIVSSITILMYEIGRTDMIQTQESPVISDNTSTDNLPDIYYIIVDGYGSNQVLSSYLSFDNSEFADDLLDRGFSLAAESKSNYAITLHSVTSSLNMEYLNYLANEPKGEVDDQRPFWQMCKNHKVWQFLKLKGYKYVHVASKWKLSGPNEYADINYPALPSNEFDRMLLNTTWLSADPSIVQVLLGFPGDNRQIHYMCTINQFENLATVIESEDSTQPKFVFCHVAIPHLPYVYEPDGTFVPREIEAERSTRDNYINQLIFCNTKIRELVDSILLESERFPIIILQADHGPKEQGGNEFDDLAVEDQNTLRFGILNAYHLPKEGPELLYSSISPVNSFRLIFNTYLGGNFELLPDESYISGFENLYEFQKVIDFPTN